MRSADSNRWTKGAGLFPSPPFYSLFHCRDLWTIDRGLLIPHSILLSHKWKQLELNRRLGRIFPYHDISQIVRYCRQSRRQWRKFLASNGLARSSLTFSDLPMAACQPIFALFGSTQHKSLYSCTLRSSPWRHSPLDTLLPFSGLLFSCYSRKSRVLPVIFRLYHRYSKSWLPAWNVSLSIGRRKWGA